MKANQKLFFILFSLLGASGLSAQENLNRWVEKCEKDPAIDITVIDYRDNDTKAVEGKTVKITFPQDSPLLKSLTEAFDKDKGNAYMAASKRMNGRTVPDLCRFNKGNTETRFSCDYKTINYGEDKVVEVTVIYNYRWDKRPQG